MWFVDRCRGYYEQLAQKASRAADLSVMTSSERHALNYVFTKEGFREAVLTGVLPDGSQLERVNNQGWYRDKLGLLRSEHGPFWPIDSGPVCPAVRHSNKCVHNVEVLTDNVSQSGELVTVAINLESLWI
jgi:hypothetical protein